MKTNLKTRLATTAAIAVLGVGLALTVPAWADADHSGKGPMAGQEKGEVMGRGHHGGHYGGHYGGRHEGGRDEDHHGQYGHHGDGDGAAHHGRGWGRGEGRGPGFGHRSGGLHHMGMGPRLTDRPLNADEVKEIIEGRLAWRGNENLAVGQVSEKDDKVITVQIVTKDGSLVRTLEIDRATGRPGFRF